MRSIVWRDDGAGWQAMLGEFARTSGITTGSADQLPSVRSDAVQEAGLERRPIRRRGSPG